VKRNLKDWSITKELALNRREWKLAIHVTESLSSIFGSFFFITFLSQFFLFLFAPFRFFCDLVFYCIFSFFWFGFLSPFVFSLFSPLFCLYFSAHVVLSLAHPNLLGTKRLGCCCTLVIILFQATPLYYATLNG
jgi:hypothetical protein